MSGAWFRLLPLLPFPVTVGAALGGRPSCLRGALPNSPGSARECRPWHSTFSATHRRHPCAERSCAPARSRQDRKASHEKWWSIQSSGSVRLHSLVIEYCEDTTPGFAFGVRLNGWLGTSDGSPSSADRQPRFLGSQDRSVLLLQRCADASISTAESHAALSN